MDAERWRRISALFDRITEAPASERNALLSDACGDDGELRREVESLLAADAVGNVLDRRVPNLRIAVAAEWVRDTEAAPVGTTIGCWRMQRELGRGGMGVVMLAERVDGQFEQRVALKLIKRGMDSEAVLARFLRERQILARLSHPNIARLLDGGLSADGRPYFVMEYVEGAQILEYCAAHSLGLRARLECALQICAALQFAHRQLIVHLDIKPSNVIVTGRGEVKLLDFGIAKLLGDGAAGPALETRTHVQRPFTPGYASPEQLLGEQVSTATDVYGIGCLLYELLTGHRAHGPLDAPSPQGARPLARDEPLAPSKALALKASDHASGLPGISPRRLRGDLDTIVLKALKREPDRRYLTVDALAEDLRRWLDGHPIAARRDTLFYRTGKFITRHRLSVSLAACALVGLLATTTFALSQAFNARAHALRAQAVTQYLVDVFRVADPKGVPGGLKLSAREVLDAGAKRIQLQLANQPQLEASLSVVLGTIYQGLGENERAIALLQRSLALRPVDVADDVSHADTLALLARAQYEKGDYSAAASASVEALAEHRARSRLASPKIAQDLALQGEIARRQGEFVQGESLLQQALAMSRATLKTPHAQIAAQLNQLAALYGDMDRIGQATALTEESLGMFRALYGESHLDVAENLVNLGVFRMQTDHLAQALPAFDAAIAIYRRLLPADHPLLALALANEARAFDRLKRYREADPLYREALAMQQRVLGDRHPDLATTLNNLAVLRMHLDDFAGSAEYSREAMAIWAAQGKPEHPFALISKGHLAVALRESGDLTQAERVTREVLASRRRQLGERNRAVAITLDDLGIVLRLSGHADQAVVQQQLAQNMRVGLAGVPPPEAAVARVQYALSESAAGDQDDARREIDAGIEALSGMKVLDPEQLATAFLAKARIELARHDVVAGCAVARQALSLRPPDDPNTGWRHAEAQGVYGECLAQRRQFGSARYQLQAALATLQHVRGTDHWMTRSVRTSLRTLHRA
ncbi:MAG TPA: serine/threonine-protein kinase [Steroidobacteraceae bacterium]|jgi:serine/threonine-protein kinase|nr:serine/threonine-protein kinase [Steroidobacteraceae bacterium]